MQNPQASRQQRIARLEQALNKTTDRRLKATLMEMLQTEYARAPKSNKQTEQMINTYRVVRAVTNPRKMKVKSKLELYDPRIELESVEEIEAKRQAHLQRRAVFQRG